MTTTPLSFFRPKHCTRAIAKSKSHPPSNFQVSGRALAVCALHWIACAEVSYLMSRRCTHLDSEHNLSAHGAPMHDGHI
ncbi:hypothetical protein PsYK624_143330 [Phanerochaete sordida]|uniref:Uncharacterized protein n=1 Tax=Phanerochaete sordida TaxID=48140 RepID=A0A9P3LK34_9APHY|nr:hypothetical protein PsYK624_143330 [Phanerochaete sordida]